jgi:hypothetical protein
MILRSERVVPAAVGIVLALLLPLVLATVPPFADLYFHLARMVVLDNPTAPYVRDWYALDWHLMPNLAMDLIVPVLAKAMSVSMATRVFVALTLLLIFSGTIALHHALYRRLSWFPLIAALFIYNQIVFFGFLNYLFGLGLSLWAATIWFYLQRRPLSLRIPVAVSLALLIYVCHLFALGVFGLIVASAEIDAMICDRRYVRHVAIAAAPFVIPFMLLLTSRTVEASRTFVEYSWVVKLFAFFSPFLTLNPPIDLVVLFGVAALLYAAIRFRALHLSRHLRFAVIAFPILVVVMPTGIIGTFFDDLRLPISAIFVTIAASHFRGHRRFQAVAAVALTGLFLVRLTALLVDFHVADREITELKTQFAHLRPGAVIFTGAIHSKPFLVDALTTPDNWSALDHRTNTLPLSHVTTLALLDQPVFVPQTAMIDGQQPTRMTAGFQRLKALQGDTIWDSQDARHLANDADVEAWLERISETVPAYHFTAVYVALVDHGGIARLPAGATELYAGHGYRLWQLAAQ